MTQSADNRFQEFFEEDKYVLLKNYLYNYRLRKRAIEKSLQHEKWNLILELGSGISPVMTRTDRIIYSDLSFSAISVLKRCHSRGHYLVADAMNLPFKSGIFSHVVCSEVFEHLKNDREALEEISRVSKSFGKIILTFPHRKVFFTNDDRYVNHYRRYETDEMLIGLEVAGFKPIEVKKVLGPLEKLTMSLLIFIFSGIKHKKSGKQKTQQSFVQGWLFLLFEWCNVIYMGLAWLDARVMPDSLSAVKLIKAQKQ